MTEDDEFQDGYNDDFDKMGEDEVWRLLSHGNFSFGDAARARIWWATKRREAAQAQVRATERAEARAERADTRAGVAETRANIALAISIVSAVATLIAAAAAIAHLLNSAG